MLDLFDEFRGLVKELEEKGIPFALCGGLAMAVYGMPRATVDIDLLIPQDEVPNATGLAAHLGFDISAERMILADKAVIIHRRSKVDEDCGDLLSVDFLEVTPPLAEVWASRRRVPWEGGEIWVVGRDGLIHMKSLRKSGLDLDDIHFLEEDLRES